MRKASTGSGFQKRTGILFPLLCQHIIFHINFLFHIIEKPDKAAVPQETLKIYSLERNVDVSAAVSFYQIQNPDVFVEYEVGIEAFPIMTGNLTCPGTA